MEFGVWHWRLVVGGLGVLLVMITGGCTAVLRSDPELQPVVMAVQASVGLPVTASRNSDLLANAADRCGGERVSFGGGLEDDAAVTLDVVRFRTEEATVRAAHQLTPAWVSRSVRDRAVAPPVPVAAPVGVPSAAMVWHYDARVAPAEAAATGVPAVPVLLVTVSAGRVVAVVESLGVPADQHADLVRQILSAAWALPDRTCWGQEPMGAPRTSDAGYVVWGTALLVVLSGIMLLPAAIVASWRAGERRTRVVLSLLWLGCVLLTSGWLLLAR